MTHRPLILAFAAVALAACSPDSAGNPLAPATPSLARNGAADPATQVQRIHGTLDAQVTSVPQPGTPLVARHLAGEGTASHLGRFTVVADFTVNVVTATSTGGHFTFTAANGDVLTGTSTGQAVVGGGIATATETVTITGGTGRFAGPTGTLTVVRRVVQATGVSSGSVDGTIMLPK